MALILGGIYNIFMLKVIERDVRAELMSSVMTSVIYKGLRPV